MPGASKHGLTHQITSPPNLSKLTNVTVVDYLGLALYHTVLQYDTAS